MSLVEEDIADMTSRQLKKLGCHAILQSRNNVFQELTSQSVSPLFLSNSEPASEPRITACTSGTVCTLRQWLVSSCRSTSCSLLSAGGGKSACGRHSSSCSRCMPGRICHARTEQPLPPDSRLSRPLESAEQSASYCKSPREKCSQAM